MDPVRGFIHLGLKMTETTLDRTLDVVRLVDTLLVASAVPTDRHEDGRHERKWPEEEQGDLAALSATLRARTQTTRDDAVEARSDSPVTVAAPKPAKKSASTKKSTSAKKSTPAKKSTSPKKSTPAKKSTSPKKSTPAKKSTSAKKSTG